jgi:hypothetical protein
VSQRPRPPQRHSAPSVCVCARARVLCVHSNTRAHRT